MIDSVVDTNVAIAANGKNTHADPECQLACVEHLEAICRDGIAILDDANLIFNEYKTSLSFTGAPGMGDAFFKHVFLHMHGGMRVRQVTITPCSDELRGFEELPRNEFDPSDRKFLAVAVVAEAEILNATDSDWSEQETLTRSLGVRVRQLCPQHASKSPDQQ